MKNKGTNKGITLIALVITIIVMLILVGVTITMAINGGLFGNAGKAVGDTQNAINKEQGLAGGAIQIDGLWYDSIEDYVKGETGSLVKINLSIEGTKTTTAPMPTGFKHKEGTIETGYVIENETDGNEFVWVPVDKNQKLTLKVESEKDITDLKLYDPYGDVILAVEDGNIETKYNNDVIVPTVNGMYMVIATTEDGITQKTLTVRSLYAMDTYNDWYSSDEYAQSLGYKDFEDWALSYIKEEYGIDSIETALAAMNFPTLEVALSSVVSSGYKQMQELGDYTESVNKNGGFYIARYEAGASTPRTSGNDGTSVADIITANGTPVSKEGYVPYNRITNDQALGLAESMYETNNSFTVSLTTNSAWDRTIGWIYETKGKTIKELRGDSTDWGNYDNAEFSITKGQYSENWGSSYTPVSGSYTKAKDDDVLLTTGATDRNEVNNIFDLAGNVLEWTNTSYSSSYRVYRGGHFYNNGYNFPAAYWSSYDASFYSYNIGFRASLYLK